MTEKYEKYESELDYLLKSLDFLKERHASSLKGIRENKEEMARLQVDIKVIKSPRLQKAATDTFNHFSEQNTNLTNTIKLIREDQKWTRRIYKIVVEWFKKHD